MAHPFTGSDDRDTLNPIEPCIECEHDPCLCAQIEAGEVCGQHRKPIEVGPYGVRYGGCPDCCRRDEADIPA